jgi:pimeloyl-ACP methyl ester carboxylesterase
MSGALQRLKPLQHTDAGLLDVAYFDAGRRDGEVTLLLHGYPYDIHTYVDVIPRLVSAGHRRLLVLLLLPDRARPSRPGSQPARDRSGDLEAQLS